MIRSIACLDMDPMKQLNVYELLFREHTWSDGRVKKPQDPAVLVFKQLVEGYPGRDWLTASSIRLTNQELPICFKNLF